MPSRSPCVNSFPPSQQPDPPAEPLTSAYAPLGPLAQRAIAASRACRRLARDLGRLVADAGADLRAPGLGDDLSQLQRDVDALIAGADAIERGPAAPAAPAQAPLPWWKHGGYEFTTCDNLDSDDDPFQVGVLCVFRRDVAKTIAAVFAEPFRSLQDAKALAERIVADPGELDAPDLRNAPGLVDRRSAFGPVPGMEAARG